MANEGIEGRPGEIERELHRHKDVAKFANILTEIQGSH